MEPIGIDAKTTAIGNNPIQARRAIKVLIVGNNPMDISHCSQILDTYRKRKFVVDFTFDLQEVKKKAVNFKPDVIILDDNLGYLELDQILNGLKSDARTIQTSVIIIKSSNYHTNFKGQQYILREAINDYLSDMIIKTVNINNYAQRPKNDGWFSFLWGR